ncbi:MAG: hypothetical protein AAF557_15320 [Pseudomonadota bacterium]
MELSTIIGLVTGTASIIGAYVSYVFARRAANRQRQFQEVELANWTHQYLSEIRTWADQVVHAMAEAVLLCDLDPKRTENPTLFDRRHAMMGRLSALVDRGRWFFPNEHMRTNQADRRIVFRGYRDPILDPVVHAHDAVKELNFNDQTQNVALRKEIVQIKRDFTDRMQVVLDPNSRNADFERFVTMTEELREGEE